jgi:hypothetical protein
MSSIVKNGEPFHGICVFGRGVFTNAEGEHGRRTYVGQIRDGHACGLGVTTYSCGSKDYAEHGPDGLCDGPTLYRCAGGKTGYDHDLLEQPDGIRLHVVHADQPSDRFEKWCSR